MIAGNLLVLHKKTYSRPFPLVVVQKKSDFILAQGLHDGSVVRDLSAIARGIAGELFRLCIAF